jgi:hypothetical protein
MHLAALVMCQEWFRFGFFLGAVVGSALAVLLCDRLKDKRKK